MKCECDKKVVIDGSKSDGYQKAFSIDAETNGLWGRAFSVAAIVYEDGTETARFVGRCPIDGKADSFVAEKVLPEMAGITETHGSYPEMLEDFSKFYMDHKQDADIIAHIIVPVESSLIRDMHDFGYIGDWDAPFPLIDLAGMLRMAGFSPSSVDDYNIKHGISANPVDFSGGTHNPLYDAAQTAMAYFHLTKHPVSTDKERD